MMDLILFYFSFFNFLIKFLFFFFILDLDKSMIVTQVTKYNTCYIVVIVIVIQLHNIEKNIKGSKINDII